jgi:carotenoid cleavage dioxygenase-like enzyme
MKAGMQHWAWDYNLTATFIAVTQRKGTPLPAGWKLGEYRSYSWKSCMLMHTAGAWEAPDGKLYLKSSQVHDNAFPLFPTDDCRMPTPHAKADFVRWEINLNHSTGSSVPDPLIVFDVPSKFPRIDERSMTKQCEYLFLNVFIPNKSDGRSNVFHGLKGLAIHSPKTGKTSWFCSGDDSLV